MFAFGMWLRTIAHIEILQTSSVGSTLKIVGGRAVLGHAGATVATWTVEHAETLTADRAHELTASQFVFADRASPEALEILRDAQVSYATAGGAWFLCDPPGVLFVKEPDRAHVRPAARSRTFSKGAARIARWLVLHPRSEGWSVRELANATEVSDATASRGVQALAGRRLVDVARDAGDARRRIVTVRDAGVLLDALADEAPWKPSRSVTWDIGARTPTEAIERIVEMDRAARPYAVGELAGAATYDRVVEPAAVTLWIAGHDLAAWDRDLLATPATPGVGRVHARIASDPYLLNWAEERNGALVADPVQLYIDCRNSNERALEAAAMLRERILRR